MQLMQVMQHARSSLTPWLWRMTAEDDSLFLPLRALSFSGSVT
jgi:hypothetical protein